MAQNLYDFLANAQAQVESGGNDYAVSPAGAQGRFQIMPATARDPGYGVRPLQGWDGANPMSAPASEQLRFRNDYQNAMGNEFQDPRMALMAYNAGPGRMKQVVNGQVPLSGLSEETLEYPDKIFDAAGIQSVYPAAVAETPAPKDTALELLSQRFGGQPTLSDLSSSAVNSALTGKYVSPNDVAAGNFKNQLETLKSISEYKKNLAYGDYYANGGAAANAMKPVYNPETGQMEYVPVSQLANGAYRPPAPTGQTYTPDGRLVRTNPSVRDEIRISKSSDAASAAANVERLANEANGILTRYETDKLAPILGKAEQWKASVFGADDATKQKIADYERLTSIANEMGAQALQQFGGNDTDKELQIAISTGIKPDNQTGTNMVAVQKKLAAAQVLQQRPVFEEQWLAKVGSLTDPDPETGETFTQAWLRTQKQLYSEALGAAPVTETVAVPTPTGGVKFLGFE